MREFLIQNNEAGQRFDKYLKKLLCNAPAGFLYKMLRKKNIVLNDRKAAGGEKLNCGDQVKLYLSEETFQKFSALSESEDLEAGLPEVDLDALPFTSLYESEDLLVIDKPSGMLSQKAKPEDISANEYLISYLLKKGHTTKEELRTFRPSVCNRIDRNTSGILLAGKTLRGLQETSDALKKRTISKYYRCIVEGNMEKACYLKGFLHKEDSMNRVSISEEKIAETDKFVETKYQPICNYENAALLEVELITGRTHQIRAHLASVGHPVVGDIKYGASRQKGIFRVLLHAFRVCLEDGTEITAPLPSDFLKAMQKFGAKQKQTVPQEE